MYAALSGWVQQTGTHNAFPPHFSTSQRFPITLFHSCSYKVKHRPARVATCVNGIVYTERGIQVC